MLQTLRLFFLSLVALAFIVFAVANRDKLDISLYPLTYSVTIPKFLFALLCFSCGAIVAWMVMCVRMAKLRHLFSAEHKRVKALENELQGMQAQPHARLTAAER